MKTLVSSTQPTRLVTGSESNPLDIIVQNISANTIYVSFDIIDNVSHNGVKLSSGTSYTNDYLTKPLYVLADVNDSELRFEVQPCARNQRR